MIKKFRLAGILSLMMAVFMVSCKDNKQVKSTDSQNVVESVLNAEETEKTENETFQNIITENEDQYPRDIAVFEDPEISERIQKLVGDEYQSILENFNTETPIVSDKDVYKFTGCKEHDCPSFHSTVLYDAKDNNLNVLVSKKGKVKVYEEKGKIVITKTLNVK